MPLELPSPSSAAISAVRRILVLELPVVPSTCELRLLVSRPRRLELVRILRERGVVHRYRYRQLGKERREVEWV